MVAHDREAERPAAQGRTVIAASGLRKTYGGVTALDGIDITLNAGEVCAVVGDNGAGKSTLVKLLSGAVQPDEGSIRIDGALAHLACPSSARAHGIETVWQELALAADLDLAANLFLGREMTYGGGIWRWLVPLRNKRMRDESSRMLADFGIDARRFISAPVRQLSGGQRQAVAICRAASWTRGAILLD